jgi:hypothetical protein
VKRGSFWPLKALTAGRAHLVFSSHAVHTGLCASRNHRSRLDSLSRPVKAVPFYFDGFAFFYFFFHRSVNLLSMTLPYSLCLSLCSAGLCVCVCVCVCQEAPADDDVSSSVRSFFEEAQSPPTRQQPSSKQEQVRSFFYVNKREPQPCTPPEKICYDIHVN